MDFSGYRPGAHVLDHLKTVDFVAVVGPSAVGKSTLMNRAEQQDPRIKQILTQTSRPLRPEETDGVDIRSRTKEAMLARIARGEYVQVAPSLFGDIYATAPEDYPAEGIGLLPVVGEAVPMFRALPFKSFKVIFVVPPSLARWQAQFKTHGFDPVRLAKRVAEAKRSLAFALEAPGVQFVINDNLQLAVGDFIALAAGDTLSPRLQADQTRAREIIQSLLAKL